MEAGSRTASGNGDGPDLIIAGIWPAQTPENCSYTPTGLMVQVENIGTQPAGPSTTLVQGGQVPWVEVDTPPIGPGQSAIIGPINVWGSIGWEVTADLHNVVPETNETNNQFAGEAICTPVSPCTSTPPATTDTPTPTITFIPTDTPTPTPVSGIEGNNDSAYDAIGVSDDGRYVTFSSLASNLVPNDTNNTQDIFVRDRQTGATTRVSVDSSGAEANSASLHPAISGDGHYVVFATNASNLTPGGTSYGQIVIHDMASGTTELVSVNDAGQPGNAGSWNIGEAPAVNGDGNFIAFWSQSTNLGGTNGKQDIFVRDRNAGTTAVVSVASDGTQADGNSGDPAISADGCHIAFVSAATNLVDGDTNGFQDIFVHDCGGATERVSMADGSQANGNSAYPSVSSDGRYVAFSTLASNLTGDASGASYVVVYDRVAKSLEVVGGGAKPTISADGRYVAFQSTASNLVLGDTNGVADIFVYDRESKQTTRASADSSGIQGNNASGSILPPAISSNGQHVAFYSSASNLVPYDTNGYSDAFVHDTQTGQTERVSLSSDGIGADLIVEDMYSAQTLENYCSTPAGLVVVVKNIGTASAGPSVTHVFGGVGMESFYLNTPALGPGQSAYLSPSASFGGNFTAVADSNNDVGEIDETNNSLTETIDLVTLPTCTATPAATFTPNPTPTPTPTLTPTVTPTRDPAMVVGGIAEPPEDFGATHGGGGLPMGEIAMLAGVAVVTATAGGWYARRRFGRQRR